MSTLKYAAVTASVLALLGGVQAEAQQIDPSKTTYGTLTPKSPRELAAFAFLVGKWQGTGTIRLDNGRFAEFPISWIGRYVLDGMAIADECHGVTPDGGPYLGITLRQYDAGRKTWIVEYVNVSNSFLRKQVNGEAGSVVINGRNVTVESASPNMSIREHYLVADGDDFVYRLDVSTDGGRTWNEGHIVMTLRRLE
jgi:hypothetical protein